MDRPLSASHRSPLRSDSHLEKTILCLICTLSISFLEKLEKNAANKVTGDDFEITLLTFTLVAAFLLKRAQPENRLMQAGCSIVVQDDLSLCTIVGPCTSSEADQKG